MSPFHWRPEPGEEGGPHDLVAAANRILAGNAQTPGFEADANLIAAAVLDAAADEENE